MGLGSVAPYTNSLVDHLGDVYGTTFRGITLEVDAEEVFLPWDQAVTCGLVLQELISNALEHAFPNGEGGVIQVGAHFTPGSHCVLAVGNNGAGFPADLGFAHPTSLGLELVHTLSHQLKGTCHLEKGPGSRFVVDFPVLDREGNATLASI